MNDFIQHPAAIPLIAFALIFGANLWVYLKREWESNHRAADYARINYPLDAASLRRWKVDGNRFHPEIIWSKQPSQWQIIQNDQIIATVPGHAPVITMAPTKFTGAEGTVPKDFAQNFILRPLPEGLGPDISLSLSPIAKEFYGDRGMDFPNDIIQVSSNIPAGEFKKHPIGYWIDDYAYMGAAGLAETDRIIKDEIGLKEDDLDPTKMDKIVHFMRSQLIDAGGVPKNDFRWKNPLQIFNEMRQGTGKGWCTQNAQIFTLLANRAGVPTRFISCGTVQNNQFVYDGHCWNECFLRDQNRWVYLDPQAVVISVFDKNGRAMNSADILHLAHNGSYDGITARTFKNWHWKDLPIEADPDVAVTVPFDLVSKTAIKQATRHTIIRYRRPPNVEEVRHIYSMLFKNWTFAWTNFRRYLYRSELAYSNMPTQGESLYRIRQLLFAGLVGSTIWLLCSIS